MNKLKIVALALLAFSSMTSLSNAVKITFSQPSPNESGTILDDPITHIALNFKTTSNMQDIELNLTKFNQKEIKLPTDTTLEEISADLTSEENVHVILYKKDENGVKDISAKDVILSQIDTIDVEAYYTIDHSYYCVVPLVTATITYKQQNQ